MILILHTPMLDLPAGVSHGHCHTHTHNVHHGHSCSPNSFYRGGNDDRGPVTTSLLPFDREVDLGDTADDIDYNEDTSIELSAAPMNHNTNLSKNQRDG